MMLPFSAKSPPDAAVNFFELTEKKHKKKPGRPGRNTPPLAFLA
jgi:hypothetical protein